MRVNISQLFLAELSANTNTNENSLQAFGSSINDTILISQIFAPLLLPALIILSILENHYKLSFLLPFPFEWRHLLMTPFDKKLEKRDEVRKGLCGFKDRLVGFLSKGVIHT